MRLFIALSTLGVASAGVIAACAPDDPPAPGNIMATHNANAGGSQGSNPAAGGAPFSTAGGPATGAGGGGLFTPSASGAPGDDRDACAGTSQAVEDIIIERMVEKPSPIALFIMQDRSSSMVGVGGGNPNGWADASGAISSFVFDPASVGLDVSLGFFPPLVGAEECATGGANCCATGVSCQTPAVPMGPLPPNAQPLVDAMANAAPSTAFGAPLLFTPTECALRGMIEACKAHTAATGEQCAAILVTDGAPTQCSGAAQPGPPGQQPAMPADPSTLLQIVADGKAAGVTTFTLGMEGADFALLDQLAEAGGGDCTPGDPQITSCDVRAGQQAFIDSLQAIRSTIVTVETEVQSTKLDCQWKIPAPPDGEDFDKDRVRVEFTADSVTPQQLGFVGAEADCANFQGGWYYDNLDAPTEVHVCPDTCEIVKASTGARIDIQFDCEVVQPVPK